MTVDQINVDAAIRSVREQMAAGDIPPALRSSLEVILLLVSILVKRLGLSSSNSSKPPSQDQNRAKKNKKATGKSRGGVPGHTGGTLEQTDTPDDVVDLPVDRTTLPSGDYTDAGYEARQVFDIDISVHVTEYRAQILRDQRGGKHIAPFPMGVEGHVQYGNGVKAHAVYLSQFQLLPYDRLTDHFADQMHLPVSAGSVYAFNEKAYDLLASFEERAKQELVRSILNHADETSININGKKHWLHGLSNERWTLLGIHKKRGKEAMDAIGVLPLYHGMLCHDHWKAYYRYKEIIHALCNAHHLRELEAASTLGAQQWAQKMQELLLAMKQAKEDAGGACPPEATEHWKGTYRELLREAEKECPPPAASPPGSPKKRGRVKRSKERNLLERLRDFEDDVLRFLDNRDVPFTNNLGERDIRMTKVHQKISGCFRSEDGAKIFCRIRSYLSSARKQDIPASYALRALFDGKDIFAMDEGGE
jgi:transposase